MEEDKKRGMIIDGFSDNEWNEFKKFCQDHSGDNCRKFGSVTEMVSSIIFMLTSQDLEEEERERNRKVILEMAKFPEK